jgi:hypothetical protein
VASGAVLLWRPSKSYALVIGESNYTNGWQKLGGGKDDITAVKKLLNAICPKFFLKCCGKTLTKK